MTEGKREIVRSLLAKYDIKDAHDIQEAEAYNGPSLIIGYAPCDKGGIYNKLTRVFETKTR